MSAHAISRYRSRARTGQPLLPRQLFPKRPLYSGDSMKPRTIVFSRKILSGVSECIELWSIQDIVALLDDPKYARRDE
jgi:hypothetical protein